jgi:hypothetical protein
VERVLVGSAVGDGESRRCGDHAASFLMQYYRLCPVLRQIGLASLADTAGRINMIVSRVAAIS